MVVAALRLGAQLGGSEENRESASRYVATITKADVRPRDQFPIFVGGVFALAFSREISSSTCSVRN